MADWLLQVLEGTSDDATLEHLRRGFRIWMNSGTRARRDSDGKPIRSRPVSLSRCLGLPDKPDLVRRAHRDVHLRAAAELIRADLLTSKSLAEALCAEVRRFSGHRWLCWSGLQHPPASATALETCLFLAMQAGGGVLPKTSRQYATILKS